MNLKDKYIVIITSPGRTGTKYFGEKLNSVINDCFSVHEPDILTSNIFDTIKKINHFGFNNMIFKRILKNGGIRQLSDFNIQKKISEDTLIQEITSLRSKYYSSINESLIVESYYAWYGLIDILPKIYDNIKIISFVRDPREWVRSIMNWGTHFGKRDLVTKFNFTRNKINEKDMICKQGDEDYLFEIICWEWNHVVSNITNQNNLIIKYEDFFIDNNKEVINYFMKYLTDWGNKKFDFNIESLNLSEVVHKNISYSYPDWKKWNVNKIKILNTYCGKTMANLQYGIDEIWQSKLKNY